MDDSSAVYAEPSEWVAYGSCGHREVCSTCVVRMRFVLEDRKSESSVVFDSFHQGSYNATKDVLRDNFMNTVRNLQLNQNPQDEAEVLSKDGYRAKSHTNKFGL